MAMKGNKLLALLLTMVLLLAMLPTVALADGDTLYIGSITSVKLPSVGAYINNVGNDTATGEWYVYNNNGSYILTLNGASIDVAMFTEFYSGIVSNVDLTINLIGNNTIKVLGESVSKHACGIQIKGHKLTLQGDGDLTVTASNCTNDNSHSVGIEAGELVMQGTGTVTVNGGTSRDAGSFGVSLSKGFNASSGTFNANSEAAPASYGIYCNGGENTYISVSGNAKVHATGGNVTTSGGDGYGILCNANTKNEEDTAKITVSGGELIAKCGNALNDDNNSLLKLCGIKTSGSLEVTGGKVTGEGVKTKSGSVDQGVNAKAISIRNATFIAKSTGSGTVAVKADSFYLGETNWYKWRTADPGEYTRSSATPFALATTTPYESYVEIAPDEVYIKTQPQSKTVTFGAISGNLTAEADGTPAVSSGNMPIYRWYQCTDTTKSVRILKDTIKTFPIPTDLEVGTHYYYCTVTLNEKTVDTNVVTVTVTNKSQPGIPGVVLDSAAEPAADKNVTGSAIVKASKLNVRQGAGLGYPVIGQLAKGDAVTVAAIDGSWAEIRYGTGTGFVSIAYLDQLTVENAVVKGAVACRNLNVRDTGAITGKILGKLHRGDAVVLDKLQNGWGRLSKENATFAGGWISLAYIQ